jgi:hypothetical protein
LQLPTFAPLATCSYPLSALLPACSYPHFALPQRFFTYAIPTLPPLHLIIIFLHIYLQP